jgi:TolB-like protein/class 3 adenylate cyclase/Tfp pilus assembly protein PilF
MSARRQLVAIMFTDIEGYTAIMQRDEQKALALKDRHREILHKEHYQFNGRIIQYYGDGTLSIFQSVVEAVQCALAMQLVFVREPEVPVRMGLHVGDVILSEDQVFGDSVNLASRIESLGVAGSILISDKINAELSNHPEFKMISAGVYQFKNVDREVVVFALDHEGLVKPRPGSLTGKTEEKKKSSSPELKKVPGKSIAVLPFVNMSNDPEQEYFGEGIAEEILNSIANLKDLKVAGRSSSFQFSKENIDIREIGEKLGVSTVLEGSIRKHGKRLRVNVQLISVEDGFHMWSEQYDRDMDDIFRIQDEVALAVAEKLKVILLEKDRARITKNYTQNTGAYELYLKGRFYISKRGASIPLGIQCFQKAIELDPNFALAHAGYADATLMAAFYGFFQPVKVIHKARESAETAIKLDPALCEPYCSLGCFYTCFERNWEKGEKNFLKSIELNPKYTQAHFWYGSLYLAWVKGDFFRAETHARIAIELEPHSAICYSMYASILHTAGKFKEGIAAAKKSMELDPDSFICHLYTGWCNLFLKRYDEATQAFEKLMKISNNHHFVQNALVIAYCITWKFKKARQLLNELKERSAKEYIAYTVTAMSEAWLDNFDEAFACLEKAYNDHDPLLISLKYEHWVPDALKEDPRFQKFLDKIGF